MKKGFKFLSAALMALAMFVPAQAETLTVCNDTYSSGYLPVQGSYYDTPGSHSQLIYPAADLAEMNGQSINSITFYAKEGMKMNGGQLRVMMGESESATYATPVYLTDLTEVAVTSVTANETEWVITLDAPYTYNGGNLVLDFNVVTAGDDSYYGWTYFYGSRTSDYVAITREGAMEKFLPKATFDYGVPADYAAKLSANSIAFSTLRAGKQETQTIVLKNTGLNAFTPVFGALEAPFSLGVEAAELASGQSLEIPVTFAPAAEGEYTATLTIDCGEAGSFAVALSANALEAADELVVCDDNARNSYLPIYGYYYDAVGTTGQMIYPADMLTDIKDGQITSITFHPESTVLFGGGQLQISLKETEQTEFTAETTISEMTVCATIVPNATDTELTFLFDTPFEYHGGNLAVELKNIVKGSYKASYFLGQNMEYNSGWFQYQPSYGTPTPTMVQFLPKATFLYKKSQVEPETPAVYIFGDVNNYAWDPTQGVEMTYADGVYTAQVTATQREGQTAAYFGFTKQLAAAESETPWDDIAAYRFGPVAEGNDWVMTEGLLGVDCALATDGSSKSIAIPAGTWTVTVDLENNTFSINGEWPTVEPEHYTGEVYILGEVNDNGGWFTNKGVQMTRDEENNVYTATITTTGEAYVDPETGIGYSYFSFTKQLVENADDWDAIDPYRFGADSDGDFLVTDETLGNEIALMNGGATFQIPAGQWNLTLSVDNMTLVIEKVAATVVRGDVDGDGDADIDDVTRLIDVVLGKVVEYNAANADCNVENGNGSIDIDDVTALISRVLNGVW